VNRAVRRKTICRLQELALSAPEKHCASEDVKNVLCMRCYSIGHSTCCHLHTEVLIQVDLGVERLELSCKGGGGVGNEFLRRHGYQQKCTSSW
jgi:hypothetical protein